MQRTRIFLTGVGGQGTLTATNLLAYTAMQQGLAVTSGEIHGMAQRGGVVESTVLLGGWLSPKIGPAEADILLGFESLETLRALPYLRPGGLVVSNSEGIPPLSVSLGKTWAPDLAQITSLVDTCAGDSIFLPCRTLGLQAGAAQSGNLSLLGALCASGALPFGVEALEQAVRSWMKPRLVDINLKAIALGTQFATKRQ